MKGIATVVLDDCFKVRIRIIEKADKLMLQMPNHKNKNNESVDDAHPLNEETRKMFEDAIFAEYENAEENTED